MHMKLVLIQDIVARLYRSTAGTHTAVSTGRHIVTRRSAGGIGDYNYPDRMSLLKHTIPDMPPRDKAPFAAYDTVTDTWQILEAPDLPRDGALLPQCGDCTGVADVVCATVTVSTSHTQR
ncbi:hypothetical protein KIPB_001318 [Kipferlia bialata]|uniref:Uncharacterized protein n=1 Tax=Kipferlia bialata TaxID=797122 RepID=A0A9K3CRV7_9EUKA|nr:hypothetical protein KIPB_001318 [Kipferlia bialata]|eukprot:g1318.t1